MASRYIMKNYDNYDNNYYKYINELQEKLKER